MSFSRKTVIQLAVAIAFAIGVLATAKSAPAARLNAAVNYTYHYVVTNIASDGGP